jgi:hypothetical protein
MLRDGAVLRSSRGTWPASPAPALYLVDRVLAQGETRWCWLIGDAVGWVTSDGIVPPVEAFHGVNEIIQRSVGQSLRGRIAPGLYVLRGLFELGEPLRGTPAANADPAAVDAAIADFTEALRLDPSDKMTHYLRARAYEGRSIPRDELAVAELTEAIRLDSHFIPAYYDRAQVYEVLAIRVWIQDYGDPENLEVVPSHRTLAFYRRAYDDMSFVVRSAPTFADARARLDLLAAKATDVENLISALESATASDGTGGARGPMVGPGPAQGYPVGAAFATGQSVASAPAGGSPVNPAFAAAQGPPPVHSPSPQAAPRPSAASHLRREPPGQWIQDALKGRIVFQTPVAPGGITASAPSLPIMVDHAATAAPTAPGFVLPDTVPPPPAAPSTPR